MCTNDYLLNIFFNDKGAHRDLPSSPTRPSSDFAPVGPPKSCVAHPRRCGGVLPVGSRASAMQPATKIRRSEEHTSEIKSRPHPACRLLFDTQNAATVLIAP